MDTDAGATTESVELREIVSRCIYRNYDGLRTLTSTLQTIENAEERRKSTLKQLVDARIVFEKVLVVSKWSIQSTIAEQCKELQKHAKFFQDQLYETEDRLRYLHADLNRSKERQYDLNSAIDVLYGGSYSKLPRVINHALQPRELPEIDEERFIDEINDIIRFRLIEEDIPDLFSDVIIEGGFAKAHVEGLFTLEFSVYGNEPDSLWRVSKVSTILTDHEAQEKYKKNANTNNIRIILGNAPTDEHYIHLRNLIQKQCNASSKPLVSALSIMSDFCSRLSLQILLDQGHVLAQTRWANTDFRPQGHSLDIVYWKTLCKKFVSKPVAMGIFEDPTKDETKDHTNEGLSIRLGSKSMSQELFSVKLFPTPPPELQVQYPELLQNLKAPTNLFLLNVEQFLLSAMEIHAASALFCLQRKLVLGANPPLHLMSGEIVNLSRSTRYFRISRYDSSGDFPLEITFDMRMGRYAVYCVAAAQSPLVERAVKQLELVLQSQCKVQLPGPTCSDSFTLVFEDEGAVHTSLAVSLREVVAYELSCFAASCSNVEVQRNVHINWDRYITFRQQTGNSIDSLSLSPHALFFQIVRNKESSGYLVVEFDRLADMESDVQNDDEWIRSPAFSLLQLQTSSIPCAVQFFQRFPAFRKDSIPWKHTSTNKKRKLDVTLSFISCLFLHVISLCHERIQLQHYVNFARRRRVKIKYAGQGGTAQIGVTTGEQIVSFPFPDRVSITPLAIRAVHGHLRKCGGFEMCVQLSNLPFDFILPHCTGPVNPAQHSATSAGNLIFRYPPIQKFQPDNPLETFMADLIMHVKPMAEFGVKLQRTLSAVGKYTSSDDIRDHFYVERADPFGFILACRTTNPKRCIAAGSSVDNLIIYRITIEYNPKHKFVLSSNHKAQHPLLTFIQTSFNIHNDSAQLLEALERTTIPLGILSSIVTSQLISTKSYKDEIQMETHTIINNNGIGGKKRGKGGKGLRIPYKGRLPGEETGYYADKSYGGDDKSFVPAELLLIPRSQNHIRLIYADRCGIDIYFMENEMINIRSAPCGVKVPCCNMDGGLSLSHDSFGDKLRSVIFPEMASL